MQKIAPALDFNALFLGFSFFFWILANIILQVYCILGPNCISKRLQMRGN